MISFQNVSARIDAGKNLGASLQSVNVSLPEKGLVALTGKSIGELELFLAVIAGMVKPESGELSINGRSTSALTKADWNALRATDIAYIKRDDSLLTKTTAAGNIDFALKMAAVPAMQRKKRTNEAFEKVGLSEQKHTKAKNLTREQTVRLHIARCLAADYSIVLMDNPLDCLSLEESQSILSLLADCAKDRLVIIATQESQAVQACADRILTLDYGVLSEDAVTESDNPAKITAPKEISRTKALACSLSLAVKGMKTRMGRTIVLCVTGILLFFVVAVIISFRTGALGFLAMVEENTLTQYPVVAKNGVLSTVTSSSDSSSNTNNANNTSSNNASNTSNATNSNNASSTSNTTVTITHEATNTEETKPITNDNLAKLKSTIESGKTKIPNYTQSIEYGYDFDPIIYMSDTSKGLYQANPSSLIALIYSLTTASQQATTSLDAVKSFHQLPSCSSLYENNFDVVAGTWPKSATDVVIVLDSDGKMDNYLSYVLGINDYDSLVTSLDKYLNGETVTLPAGASEYDPATLMNRTFKLVMKSDCYVKDESSGTWRNKTYNEQFMKNLVDNGTTLNVCGVVKPNANNATASEYKGICYSAELQDFVSNYNYNSRIVQEQLAKPETNVLTEKSFADEAAGTEPSEEELAQKGVSILAWLLDVDESALDPDNVNLETLMNSEEVQNFLDVVASFDANSIDTSSFNLNGMPLPDLNKVLTLAEVEKVEVHPEVIGEVFIKEIAAYLNACIEAEISGKPTPTFKEFWQTDQAQKIFKRLETDLIDTSKISPESQQKVADYVRTYLSDELAPYLIDKAIVCTKAIVSPIADHTTNVVIPYLLERIGVITNHVTSTVTSQLSEELGFDVSSLASEDGSALSLKSYFIKGLLTSLSDPKGTNSSENIATFGCIDKSKPTQISFYANSVSSKDKLDQELTKYNKERTDEGNPELKVTYVDMAGGVTDVASTVIAKTANILLLLLFVFVIFGIVAIHFSIRAITFESIRQAALLRCIGGGKRHVFAMYMFEAMLDGLIFSAIGVIMSMAVCGSLTGFVQDGTGISLTLYLTWYDALGLVGFGLLMGALGALLPALKASRKDISEYAF